MLCHYVIVMMGGKVCTTFSCEHYDYVIVMMGGIVCTTFSCEHYDYVCNDEWEMCVDKEL